MPDSAGGQTVTYTQIAANEPARLSQPATSARRNENEMVADRPHSELSHSVYFAPFTDVRRNDELRHASGLVMRVIAVAVPSIPVYVRADCVADQVEPTP